MSVQRLREKAEAETKAYSEHADDERPLAGYLGLLASYGGLLAAGAGIVRLRGAELPERLSVRDLALLTVATHKVSRIVTKDPVTSPIRAGVTSYERPAGEGEVVESVRGSGFRHALGELLTCPFCIAQWIATVFAFGIVLAPRATRFMASTFAILTGSDLLQFAYAAARRTER
jgi:hypothetical protein